MANKKENTESFAPEVAKQDDAPVEVISVAEENTVSNKLLYAIIAIMPGGCLARNIQDSSDVRQLYGAQYATKKVGDIVEL